MHAHRHAGMHSQGEAAHTFITHRERQVRNACPGQCCQPAGGEELPFEVWVGFAEHISALKTKAFLTHYRADRWRTVRRVDFLFLQ